MFYKNKNKKYFGIEPDIYFLITLKRILIKINYQKKIKIYKNFITSKKKIGFLVGPVGQKFIHSKFNKIENQISLDDFIDVNCIKNLELIKIDTDGYDYDVLKSGNKNIKKFKPIIFFECQIDNKKRSINIWKNLKI